MIAPANEMSTPTADLAMRRVRRVHLVGIGGSGMSGIAEVLLNLGYVISGSDIAESDVIARLRKLGADIAIGHQAPQVEKSDVAVVSSAISVDNVEWRRALDLGIPVVPRAEMLAELMRFRYGIAVAGAHGKTTTTSMIASTLAAGGADPTFIIGGCLRGTDASARLGRGRYLVAEADESDASFVHLQPMLAVVTNLDADHLENYDGDFDKLFDTYLKFVHNLPFYGRVIYCADDPTLRRAQSAFARPSFSYGFSPNADFHISNFVQEGLQSRFTVHRPQRSPLHLRLGLPGRHNVQNATAAVAVAAEEEIDDTALAEAIASFAGVDRRFQVRGPYSIGDGDIMLVDDYGHHPTELGVVMEVARQLWPERRLLMMFQPHRYTRLRDLYEDFVSMLSRVDALLMLDTYAAGEAPIKGADSRSLCRSLRLRSSLEPVFVANRDEILDQLMRMLRPGDVLLTQGAGDIGALVPELVALLSDIDGGVS